MPRLIVPSSGGGRKLMRTLLAGAAEGDRDCSGVGETEGDSSGVGEGVGAGDSGATAATANSKDTRIGNRQSAIGILLNVIAPVYVWESVIAPFTVAQKFFIDSICDELIVQSIEAGKMIHRPLGCVFACRSGLHEESPVARLRQQKFAGQLLEDTIS